MKERPILFSAEMVRALLDGRKTMTRRVMKPQPIERPGQILSGRHPCTIEKLFPKIKNLYGQPGDRLWVKEGIFIPRHMTHRDADMGRRVMYVGDMSDADTAWCKEQRWKKMSPIHCYRWASRILLEITNVRVERVQQISNDDARQEGVPEGVSPRAEFIALWDSINAARGFGWDANPSVWVIEFRPVSRET